MIRKTGKRDAFTLVEMMCVMVVFVVLVGVLGLLMKEAFLAERLQADSFERLQIGKALADAFRADAAQAVKAPAEFGDFTADAQTLIFEMKEGKHVVYAWREGTLRRTEFVNQEETTRELPIPKRTTVELVPAVQGTGVVRLRLAALHLGQPAPGQALEFAAAVGGDWR